MIHHRQPRRRNPLLQDTPEGQWNPEAAGVMGYPRTQEAYDAHKERLRKNSEAARAAGKLTRKGVPNGFRGRRAEVEALRADAADEGWKIAQVVCRNSVTPEEMLEPTTDDARAAMATAGLIAMALDPTMTATMRLKAFQAVLPYLRPMPTKRVKVELANGIEWLRSLAGEAA